MKMVRRISLALLSLVLSGAFFAPFSCSSSDDLFAIYLAVDNAPPGPSIGTIELAAKPIISLRDIITYNAQTHELKLEPEAFERICELEDAPVSGKTFVVCVKGKPIYQGAFWTPVSSISFNGVTVWKPLSVTEPHVITFVLGYPSPLFYGGEDPRNNQEILDALQRAGKLIYKTDIEEINQLPHSMKGYELYSWSQDDRWHFTLITGTNRNKTPEEIISSENYVSESGWVKVHVMDIEAIETVLEKLPPGEEIFWLAGAGTSQLSKAGIIFGRPPDSSVSSLKACAVRLGLDLSIL